MKTKTDNKEDARLARLAMRGNMAALAELFEQKQQNFLATALYICGNKQDAEDAVQNSFIEIHGSIGKLRSPSKVNAWMSVILRRQCYKLLAGRRQDHSIEEMDEAQLPVATQDESSPEKYLETKELRERMVGIVKSLPPRSREVVFYYYYDEMSVKEIAELTCLRISTVTSVLARARLQIKKEILAEE